MKRSKTRCLAILALAATALDVAHTAVAQTVPTDASGGCPIPPATVASFFESGSVSLNGIVKPANSDVSLHPNCEFFQWSEQMFLWLTSPAPSAYGGGSHVMFSPQFFAVSPEDSAGRRTFIPNRQGLPIHMLLRATELGPNGLPALLARSGHVIEVQRPNPNKPEPPIVLLLSGAQVQLSKVLRLPDGTLQFFDTSGKQVQPSFLKLEPVVRSHVTIAPNKQTAIVPAAALQQAIQARKFTFGDISIFVDLGGSVIDVEPGQADGGVLISQSGSLIYYITAVNDVFAYHRTMQGAALIPFVNVLTLPLSIFDVNPVVAFAAGKGHTILHPEALAVETKSSWIEASAVPNPSDYIQVTATVPTFDKSDPNNWVPNGQAAVPLVMIGLHVVGSAKGNGELVWSTFEHLGNAPNATYAYNSTSGLTTVPQNTSGSWLFTPGGSAGPFNTSNARWSGTAITGTPVGPSVVLRAKPWGSNDGGNPASVAGINTEVISVNASVISQLDPADVRRNYFQRGTTWTDSGQPPRDDDQVGTHDLANATIETFMQGSTSSDPGSNCFSCHTTATVSVSHIYRQLVPLP